MYKGQFYEGWDVTGEQIYHSQIAKGIIPKGTQLADKPDDIKDRNKLSKTQKKLFSRQAEVFAAFIDILDSGIGRLINNY